jgi:hypothetical protein
MFRNQQRALACGRQTITPRQPPMIVFFVGKPPERAAIYFDNET